MKKTKLLPILLLPLLMASSFASNNTAKVLFVRGDVTMLLPHSHKAKGVAKGDVLPEDTSVLTSAKGIVKVQMPDNSVVSLGPKSKLVVALMEKDKPSMLGLLKGVVRAEVEKAGTNKNKMIIKTRTAAMGIRGTKLKTSFNPETRTTSLVTIEGKVAMAKIQEKKIIKEAQDETNKEQLDNPKKKNSAEFQKNVEVRELQKLEEALERSDTVEVNKGRYAGVNIKLGKPIEPTKVNPKQMVAIATHDELAVAKVDEKKYKKELLEELKEHSDEDAEAEFDKSDGKLKPKDGGLVDFDTGIYVSPSENAKLDKETGTYIAENDIGATNEKGEYIAPKGLKLDAKKGFVVDKKSTTIAQRSRLEDSIKLLNNDVKELVVTDKEIKAEIKAELAMVTGKKYEKKEEVVALSADEPKKEYLMNPTVKEYGLEVSLTPFVTSMTVDSDVTASKNELASVVATHFMVNFTQKWESVEKLKTSVFAGADFIEFDDNEQSYTYDQDKKIFPEVGIGFQYDLSEKHIFTLTAAKKSSPFIESSNNSQYQVLYTDVMNTKVSLGYKTLLLDNGIHNGYAGLVLSSLSGQDQNSKANAATKIEVKSGHAAELNWDMSFNNIEALNLSAGAFLRYERQNIDESQYRRYTLGIGAKAKF